MTEEIYGKILCLDHCLPLSKTNFSNENDMYKSTNWINFRPMYETVILLRVIELIIIYTYYKK